MTKEELEKEADEYSKTVKCQWESETYWVDCYDEVTDAYIAGAEPREKRIAELEDINKELFHALSIHDRDVLLTNKKIAELEAQIEKMKCCYNCKHSRTEYEHCKTDKSEKWEMKEK